MKIATVWKFETEKQAALVANGLELLNAMFDTTDEYGGERINFSLSGDEISFRDCDREMFAEARGFISKDFIAESLEERLLTTGAAAEISKVVQQN